MCSSVCGMVAGQARIRRHQRHGYCAGYCQGDDLKMGRTVGSKQGMSHFGFLRASKLTAKTNRRPVPDKKVKSFGNVATRLSEALPG